MSELRSQVVEAIERAMLKSDAVQLYSDEAHTLAEAALDAALTLLEERFDDWWLAAGGVVLHTTADQDRETRLSSQVKTLLAVLGDSGKGDS